MRLELARIESDQFNHRTVERHFINRCCFGEDLVGWLRDGLRGRLDANFVLGEPTQEDYGWCLPIERGKARFVLHAPFVGDGPTDEPGQWDIELTHSAGLVARLLGKADAASAKLIGESIATLLAEASDIQIVELDGP